MNVVPCNAWLGVVSRSSCRSGLPHYRTPHVLCNFRLTYKEIVYSYACYGRGVIGARSCWGLPTQSKCSALYVNHFELRRKTHAVSRSDTLREIRRRQHIRCMGGCCRKLHNRHQHHKRNNKRQNSFQFHSLPSFKFFLWLHYFTYILPYSVCSRNRLALRK
jgi:hypothetical protein